MVISNCQKMDERVQLTESIVNGTIEEMIKAAASARTTMSNNARSFAKPEAKPVIEALELMAGHSERAKTSLVTMLAEVSSFRAMLHEIMEDLKEHLQVYTSLPSWAIPSFKPHPVHDTTLAAEQTPKR